MTSFTKLAPDLYITGQISPEQIKQASTEGIKTIVNLRPDGEKTGYIDAADASDLAVNGKLNYHHLPIAMTGPNQDQVNSFGELLENCEAPVLVHCGTGKRAAILWALCNKGILSVDEIIKCCADCGHDISKMRPHL